jgi:uncharacterized surface protein with fasciclin (FAS1) repeats
MRMHADARKRPAGVFRRLSAVMALLALTASCGGTEEASPPEPTPTATSTPSPTESPALTVAGVLATDERFETLFQALLNDPLFLERMSGPAWNHTVFAPTNEAFEKLPARRLASLLEDENRLRQLIDNHIAFELVPTEEMEAGDLQTIQGVHEVDPGGDPVTIDGVSIVEADLETSNGIIHAIDGVLTVLCRQIGTGEPQCTDLLED